MRLARTLTATGVAAALVAAPIAAATAADAPAHTKARFAVTGLQIVTPRTVDVADGAAVVKVRVQVKDFDRQFDPRTVKLVVTESVSGAVVDAFSVQARLLGKSRVVSNWAASITIPQGSPAGVYTVKLVKVDDASASTFPVVKRAERLPGRDTVRVVG
jgi:hypothetical protein